MKKIIKFLISKFWTKSFLSFVLIGFINTFINTLCYKYSKDLFDSLISSALSINISTAIAFIIASIFSYFANAKYSFKVKKRTNKQFVIVMSVFLFRMFLTMGATYLFDVLYRLMVNTNLYSKTDFLPNLVASILMIPIFYFALAYVYKKTDIDNNNK